MALAFAQISSGFSYRVMLLWQGVEIGQDFVELPRLEKFLLVVAP